MGDQTNHALKVLDLFSGIGAFSLGLEAAGMETVRFVEIDPFCREVLKKHWPNVPCDEDITKAEFSEGEADVICGGFPCQDLSRAGERRGLGGERSSLWFTMADVIRVVRPSYVIVENVDALLDCGMDTVLRDLSDLRYDAEWSVVSACAMGAPHMRRRVFIVAYPNGKHGREGIWNPASYQNRAVQAVNRLESARSGFKERMANPSELYGNADGVPFGSHRNHAIGNSIYWPITQAIGEAIMAAEKIKKQRALLDKTLAGRPRRDMGGQDISTPYLGEHAA